MPVAIATWEFGPPAVDAAGAALLAGATALDAVEAGINVTELDPAVMSVGYGGLPNSAGVVEVDAAVMDGATHNAGSVAGVRGIRRPVSLARAVMERSRHVMLVGPEALAFALRHGFSEEEMLTKEARRRWEEHAADRHADHDTIGLAALDSSGNLAVGCSTSGIGFKDPGRVGDSPIIGSGLYVDNAVGAAAATGVGEEIMKFCASFLAVEFMRAGRPPEAACRDVIDRMVSARPANADVRMAVIALGRDGTCGAAATMAEFPYAVWTPAGSELRRAGREPV